MRTRDNPINIHRFSRLNETLSASQYSKCMILLYIYSE
jgi:hypothetical protein